jgi:hypothetical protein
MNTTDQIRSTVFLTDPRPQGMLRQRRADHSTLPEELVLRRLD